MKKGKAVAFLGSLLLVLLAVVGVSGQTQYTYVSNQSSKAIRGTTIYGFAGTSGFVDRLILPGHYDHDEYSKPGCGSIGLTIFLHVDGNISGSYYFIGCNWSVVAVDNGDKTAVDVYYSVDGSINEPTGKRLFTIHP